MTQCVDKIFLSTSSANAILCVFVAWFSLVLAVRPFHFKAPQEALISVFDSQSLSDYVVDSKLLFARAPQKLVEIKSISDNELNVGQWLGAYLKKQD